MKHSVGNTYNQLTLIEKVGNYYWLCLCTCGTYTRIHVSNLTRTKSCGCARIVNCKNIGMKYGKLNGLQTSTHQQSRCKEGRKPTKEYNAWSSMKKRCLNKKDKAYKNYGARGITICSEWITSFESFYKDMGKAPIGYQLDRIDNEGNYEASNCRWVTPKENINNRRCSKK